MYSHVGLLVRTDGEWKVLHAVPGEEAESGGEQVIKCDPLNLFFRSDRAVSGCIMRYDTSEEVLSAVRSQAFRLFGKRVLFDHDYNRSDSSRMYCTEYVCYIFSLSGVDLAEDRWHRFPMAQEKIVYPIDLVQNNKMKKVWSCDSLVPYL